MDWQGMLADWWDHEWVRTLAPGLGLALLAIMAWRGDRRRMRRSNPDAVGLLPWRDIAFWASVLALLLLGLAAREWMA
jgi:hypothetical protein